MSSNVDSNPAQQHRVQTCLNQLNGEVVNLLEENSIYLEEIARLKSELSVYKRAYTDIESERNALEKSKIEVEKQNEDLEARLKGHRIVALIDGDGAIFRNELLSQGQTGGLQAARQLSDHLTQYMTQNFGSRPYKFWVYIFLNKRGLMQSLAKQNQLMSAKKLEGFITGFNQAAERFSVVDVGEAKEAADTKLKTYLEDESRTSHTFKVIFGGCHDNGYVTSLRSQITAGFRDKLILLKSYTDMAVGISELGLPAITIPDLFVAEKMKFTQSSEHYFTASGRSNSASVTNQEPDTSSMISFEDDQAITTVDHWQYTSGQYGGGPDDIVFYATQKRRFVDLNDNDSTFTDIVPSSENHTLRQINPKIPIYKHKPPPCNLFYLIRNCKNGSDCRYGHDYELNQKHLDEMRRNARKSPCPSTNKGEKCIWGEAKCCYGHFCPALSKCFYLKQGRCKFIGANMHTEFP